MPIPPSRRARLLGLSGIRCHLVVGLDGARNRGPCDRGLSCSGSQDRGTYDRTASDAFISLPPSTYTVGRRFTSITRLCSGKCPPPAMGTTWVGLGIRTRVYCDAETKGVSKIVEPT